MVEFDHFGKKYKDVEFDTFKKIKHNLLIMSAKIKQIEVEDKIIAINSKK